MLVCLSCVALLCVGQHGRNSGKKIGEAPPQNHVFPNVCRAYFALVKPGDVLSKNRDSLALGFVLLAYSRGLVQTVRGGPATPIFCRFPHLRRPLLRVRANLSFFPTLLGSECNAPVTSITKPATRASLTDDDDNSVHNSDNRTL